MAENVRVVVRCRPLSDREREMKCQSIINIDGCVVRLRNPNDSNSTPPKLFTYDNAYESGAETEAIYNDICYALIENVLEGYNGTIFAYGQTGCGKSHTMQGPNIMETIDNAQSQRGIISRSFDHIFEAISVASGLQFLVQCSYLEIYNETIRDLLKPTATANPNISGASLQLKEIAGEGVVVQNLSTHTVHTAAECERLLEIGAKNRIVGATLMNAGSSRSHSIFTISVEQIETKHLRQTENEADNRLATDTGGGGIKKGKLNLVDLAGSERQNKTGATGDRLKEATKINLSLSALGNVISALVDGRTKHVPYRDSKLTRLLQDSLGGNTKTLMIACISPANYNYDETLSTLRYASRAKNIHNKPKINEDPKEAMLREYQREIMELRHMLESTSSSPSIGSRISVETDDVSRKLEEERAKLKAEYEAERLRLRQESEAQQKEKEELVKDMERLKIHYETEFKNLTEKQPAASQFHSTNAIEHQPKHQQEVLDRIDAIKNALIGGERANDHQLKEKRQRKKLAAQRRLSALAQALSRVEQSKDRDLIQEHYSDIQHELNSKTDQIKSYRQKVRGLEREVDDLQSEFQLDRADYLETIRKLERNLKFYQQLFEKALPTLRKNGRFWDPESIQRDSEWNDDLKRWRLPEDSIAMMSRLRLPPADLHINTTTATTATITAPGRLEHQRHSKHTVEEAHSTASLRKSASPKNLATATTHFSEQKTVDETFKKLLNHQNFIGNATEIQTVPENQDFNIAETYFRPKRANELIQQQRKTFNNWKDLTNKTRQQRLHSGLLNSNWIHNFDGQMAAPVYQLPPSWITGTTATNKKNFGDESKIADTSSNSLNKTWSAGHSSLQAPFGEHAVLSSILQKPEKVTTTTSQHIVNF